MEPISSASPEMSEAARSRAIASKLLAARDLLGSKRFAERALSADPDLPDDRADQILAIADVLLTSQDHRVNNHADWYSLLNLPHPNPNPNLNNQNNDHLSPAPADFTILLKRHYRRLALLLHPDRNKFPGAHSAFQLVVDAYNVLSDPTRKSLFDAELLQMPAAAAAPPMDGNSFWTMCPSCCHVHQYPRTHQGRSLRCHTCRRCFYAVEMQPSPSVVPGTNTYHSSWGFFPLGFPTSVKSDWKPFVPMFPWTPGSGGVGSGGGGIQGSQPPAKHAIRTPVNAVAPSGKGTKKMARKKVASGLKKRVLTSDTPNPRVDSAGIGGRAADVSFGKEEVGAKGIDMNKEAKGPEEAEEHTDFDMLIDLDASDDVLGNLHNLPFLRDEDMNIHIP
ncbi:uncharacterized protein M6B38_210095 [Iris pallida]|uniref:J domain-containing protein n=1 Tax=Iris pallida TaxID=29817 RepID=A0AAX6E3Q3_IRIPA|nr:uncharacterized protein M6B38_210095 [Iris pallida]